MSKRLSWEINIPLIFAVVSGLSFYSKLSMSLSYERAEECDERERGLEGNQAVLEL
jgi:hypothetical protein